jgi:hypothetical protein
MGRSSSSWISSSLLLSGLAAAASPAMAVDVYVLSTGSATVDAAYVTALSARGHSVTIGRPWSTFDGTVDLSGFEVVLLNHGNNWGGALEEIPEVGQQQLVNFINAGGGVITTEWIVYNFGASNTNAYNVLAPALPVTYGNFWNSTTSTTFTALTADPIMNAGLPGSFISPTDNFAGVETRLIPKPGATNFFSSSNMSATGIQAAGVAGWTFGSGRVISISTMPGVNSLANANYATMLSNSVNWVAVPTPGALSLLGLGAIVAGRRRR